MVSFGKAIVMMFKTTVRSKGEFAKLSRNIGYLD